MTNLTEDIHDQDVEWLYARLERVNKRPTEEDEDMFCGLVRHYVRKGSKDMDARNLAFREMYA